MFQYPLDICVLKAKFVVHLTNLHFRKKKVFSLLTIAKVSKVLHLSNIATTVENQVKVV